MVGEGWGTAAARRGRGGWRGGWRTLGGGVEAEQRGKQGDAAAAEGDVGADRDQRRHLNAEGRRRGLRDELSGQAQEGGDHGRHVQGEHEEQEAR